MFKPFVFTYTHRDDLVCLYTDNFQRAAKAVVLRNIFWKPRYQLETHTSQHLQQSALSAKLLLL